MKLYWLRNNWKPQNVYMLKFSFDSFFASLVKADVNYVLHLFPTVPSEQDAAQTIQRNVFTWMTWKTLKVLV